MKICIVGAGAIGGILAAQLAQSGHRVCLIARGKHLEAIQDRGLTLVNHLRDAARYLMPMAAHHDPVMLAAQEGIQDVVIVGLKANAIPAMLGRIAPLVGPQTMVVPAINGLPWWYFYREGGAYQGAVIRSVDPDGSLLQELDAARIVGCVVHLAGEVRAPGEVHYTAGRRLIVGEIDRSLADPSTGRVEVLRDSLTQAGFDVVLSRDIRVDVWAKLVGNLSFNPVAALASALMDQICADPDLLEIVRPLLREGMQVAAHLGIEFRMTPDERIDLARQLGRAKISMHQDFEAGRPPEIDAIVGAVIELAQWGGVAIPTIRMIDALVRARARNLGLIGPTG
jgi:2-dehydropantoate 2-reductase